MCCWTPFLPGQVRVAVESVFPLSTRVRWATLETEERLAQVQLPGR